MSRSKRKPAHYFACGANPKKGKELASRAIRRTVRQLLSYDEEDFDFVHPMDKNRGDAGSRTSDYGWDYFGDGRLNPYRVEGELTEEEKSSKWFQQLCRK